MNQMNWDEFNTIERILTTEELATVVRAWRISKKWSQETLAELAQINVRGIQRVEKGINVSIDTKRAIAAAFEMEDIDFFDKPQILPDIEKLRQMQKEYEKNHVTLKTKVIKTGKSLTLLAEDCNMDMPDSCEGLSREADKVFANLIDSFRDYREVYREYTQTMKLSFQDELQVLLDELESLGMALVSATQKVTLTMNSGDTMKAQIAYFCCFPSDNIPKQISVPKQNNVRF